MQVDEVTVIRLSPIVYNKELVKTELLSQIPTLAPYHQSNIWERQRNKKKGQTRDRQLHTWAYTHIYIYKHYMSLSLYVHIYVQTHTNISQTYILGRWRENFQEAGEDFKGKNQEVYTETLHLFVSAAVPDVSPVLAEKSRINPVALELSNVSEGNSNFLGQLQERCKGWFTGGEWVEDGVWHTGEALAERWHGWQTLRCRKMGLCAPADAVSVPGKNCTAVFRAEMCIPTAARDRGTMSLALWNILLAGDRWRYWEQYFSLHMIHLM